MKTKIFTLCLAVVASMSLLKAEIYSGTCGDEATWSFNSATATLTISGSGSMHDTYEEGGPWCRFSDYNIQESTKHVIIEEGITRIGEWNFYYHPSLKTVEIASTVTYIDHLAFAESINIQSVTCKAKTAPEFGDMIFTITVPHLYVPEGCISAYESWSYFFEDISEDGHITVRTQLPDTTVCQGEWVAIGDTEGKYFYQSGSISHTYAVSDEKDSIVTRNVNVKQLFTPYILTRNEEGSLHSGSILIYDNYYYNYSEYTTHSNYDYFTVNGVRYDHKPDPEEAVVEISYGSVYGNASYGLSGLSAGSYEFVFYMEDCDLTYRYTYTIQRMNINVDGLCYNFFQEWVWEDDNSLSVQKWFAEVTRKYTTGDGNYTDSKIVIPEQITLDDTVYTVKRIGSSAFSTCRNLKSVTIPATIERINDYAFNSCSNLNEIILYPKTAPYIYDSYVFRGIASDARFLVSIGAYSSYSGSYYWSSLNLQPAVKVNAEVGPTNCTLTFEGLMDEIKACCIKDGEKSEGNTIEYVGLEPNSTYSNVEFVVYNEDNASAVLTHTFQTSALELTTLESKAASSTTAILLAETNISDAETNCGFEWKRYEAPSDMNPTKVYATVQNGIMAGRLKGLKDDVYYQYRAFYESASGKIYRGAWQYIFTGDAGVEFEPILYTEPAHIVRENEAILRGFALAGSEEITEQGFEYWVEKRVNIAQEESANGSRNMPADIHGQRHLIQAEGVSMEATITDLDAGTLYKFRVYAKAGGVFYYGGEQSFITYGVYEGEDAYTAVENIENQETATKILRDGQILILRDGKTYTVTGQVVK